MAEKSPWLLRVIARQDDLVEEDGGQPYRGELLYKGDVLWILSADSEEELEYLAREKQQDAWGMADRDEDDPDADDVTYIEL